jgi:hypothetical protein
MLKKANSVEKEPEALRWSWMPENLKPFMTDDHGSFRQTRLLEQIATSTDQSDYLWYRTRYSLRSIVFANLIKFNFSLGGRVMQIKL